MTNNDAIEAIEGSLEASGEVEYIEINSNSEFQNFGGLGPKNLKFRRNGWISRKHVFRHILTNNDAIEAIKGSLEASWEVEYIDNNISVGNLN